MLVMYLCVKGIDVGYVVMYLCVRSIDVGHAFVC
jgi:hypothetical protein